VFAAGRFDPGVMKRYPEIVSPWLLGVVTAVFALRTWRTGNPLCAILTGLALAFTCREIHFSGTGRGVKIAVVVLAVWAVAWRKRLTRPIRDIAHVRWVVASGLTYALSVVIAKRTFAARHLALIPNEEAIHITLEEGLELAAHLLLLLSAVMGSWKARYARTADGN